MCWAGLPWILMETCSAIMIPRSQPCMAQVSQKPGNPMAATWVPSRCPYSENLISEKYIISDIQCEGLYFVASKTQKGYF
jgi:hypothetical protein